MLATDKIIRVIFLDCENAIRSQMAEALLRQVGGDRFDVHSGGIEPQPIHPFTINVMEELGIAMNGHESKSLQRYFNRNGSFDVAILVSLADEANCPRLFPGTLRIERWSIPNPLLGDQHPDAVMERFRLVRDRIKAQCLNWIEQQKDPETGIFFSKRSLVGAH